MKTRHYPMFFTLAVMLASGVVACSQGPVETASEDERPQAPRMKMTTEIPPAITIPDEVETRLGTLRFEDGFPTEETAQKIYDQLDFQRAVESVILTTPAASLTGFRNGIREYGPDNQTAIIWEERMDSKVQLLTPNTTVVYLFLWLDLKDGPMVMEVAAERAGADRRLLVPLRHRLRQGRAGPGQGR